MSDRRLAVIDLGSNSFRLVVFTWGKRGGHGWWRRTDEIYEAVRVGAGLDAAGELQPEPMERALETIELFAHFCRAMGIDDVRPVATSAIRDATNQDDFLTQARKRSGLEIEVLSPEEEARYGYLAAVNSTTLVRRRRARPRRRLDAAHPRRGPPRARRALVAARRGAHDRALPGRRRASSASSSRRCARTSPTSWPRRAGSTTRARTARASRASAARCATSRPRRRSRPTCRRSASRASCSSARRSTSSSSASPT